MLTALAVLTVPVFATLYASVYRRDRPPSPQDFGLNDPGGTVWMVAPNLKYREKALQDELAAFQRDQLSTDSLSREAKEQIGELGSSADAAGRPLGRLDIESSRLLLVDPSRGIKVFGMPTMSRGICYAITPRIATGCEDHLTTAHVTWGLHQKEYRRDVVVYGFAGDVVSRIEVIAGETIHNATLGEGFYFGRVPSLGTAADELRLRVQYRDGTAETVFLTRGLGRE